MEQQAVYENNYIEVVEIKEIGEGMRVCIDFVDVLDKMDGLYVGNTGHGYLKVLSENRHSEGYPPRPFRINVGAFHQYLYQDKKSNYLQEIQSGEKLAVTGSQGDRMLPIGRVKIEKRPLIRIVCKDDQQTISATLQKSSSVYVEEEKEGAVSIIDLKIGDKINYRHDKPGRHLGEQIDEIIIEK